ncbi:hypothetical protein [Pseudomonas sp. TWI628]|uniref:hypothetical protein n=1 Tax=Pseudomonas sp. TWI628 TaxID=3136788 RepID=UPI00320B1190
MKTNSKSELLKRLAEGNVMFDWGAIVAFDRGQINRMLREEYLSAFSNHSYLAPFSIAVGIGDDERATLSNIVLGAPQVSFENATFTNRSVTVRLNILAGTYASTIHVPGSPPFLRQSVPLREDMGMALEMTADLEVRAGNRGDRSMVTLDLSSGTRFSCNLGGASGDARVAIGEALGKRIKAHPTYRQLYTCATLGFNDYGVLTPRNFSLLTQPAPEGRNPRSTKYGDGALVLFCQLRINMRPGRLPGNPDQYPYLIPDDLTAQGTAAYNTTTLIAENLRRFVSRDETPDVLRQLRLPNAYQVDMAEREDPLDHVIFGSVEPSAQSYFVEPMQGAVLAGERQPYVLDNEGQTVDVKWTAINMNSEAHTGAMVGATYQAPLAETFRRDQQLVRVSASFDSAEGPQTRTGLLVESRRAVNILPRVATWGTLMGPVELQASSLSGAELIWELTPIDEEGSVYGELLPDPKQPGGRLFKPYEPGEEYLPEVRLQHIRVTDPSTGSTDIATVVIFAYRQVLNVMPFHVPVFNGAEPIAFRLRPDDHEEATWKVFGEGDVDDDGHYTPPSHPTAPVSVIMADIDDRYTGYAIVEHAYQNPPITWQKIQKWEIKVLGAPVCLANGMQQILVEVAVETDEFDFGGIKYKIPVSDDEMSTMKLVYRATNAEVQDVGKGEEGLPSGVNMWATNAVINRFDRYDGAKASDDPPAVRSEETRNSVRFYLQSGIAGVEEFYAMFTAEDGTPWKSKDKAAFLETTAVQPVRPGSGDYKLTRERVFNGKGYIFDPGTGAPKDEFTYMRDSIDYWTLSYEEKLETIKFATCEPEGAATSIRWESDQVKEKRFSYLGCIFKELPVPNKPEKPHKFYKEQMLTDLAAAVNYNGIKQEVIEGKEPGPGELIIMLHRLADMPYWYDGRANGDETRMHRITLDQPMMLVLYDMRGTRHRLRIGFPEPTVEDSRNQLILSVQ